MAGVRLAQIMMEAGLNKVENASFLSPRKLPLLSRMPSSAVCAVLMVASHKTGVRKPSQTKQLGWCPRSGSSAFSHLGSKPLRGSREEGVF